MISPDETAELHLVALRLAIKPNDLQWQSQATDWIEARLNQGDSTPAMIRFSIDQYDDDFRFSIPNRVREILRELGHEYKAYGDPSLAWREIARLYATQVVSAEDPYPTFVKWSNEPVYDPSYSDPIFQIRVDFGWEYDSQTHPYDPYSEPDRKRKTDLRLIAACKALLRTLKS
ncbi:MAG: hypothetical protein LAT64_03895 [Phycisphaerales bacterium]|nr:hypothetical protein [Planctomycetota bacterium]MCH8507894.1 hypothetical protein [Phycisphaerales bacterium]